MDPQYAVRVSSLHARRRTSGNTHRRRTEKESKWMFYSSRKHRPLSTSWSGRETAPPNRSKLLSERPQLEKGCTCGPPRLLDGDRRDGADRRRNRAQRYWPSGRLRTEQHSRQTNNGLDSYGYEHCRYFRLAAETRRCPKRIPQYPSTVTSRTSQET